MAIIHGEAKREWNGADLDPRDFLKKGIRFNLFFNDSFDLIIHPTNTQDDGGYILRRRSLVSGDESSHSKDEIVNTHRWLGSSSKKSKGKGIELAKSYPSKRRRISKHWAVKGDILLSMDPLRINIFRI
jgi:hypothetical protein